MSRATDLAQQLEKAFAAGPEAFADLFADDAVQHHPLFPEPMVGRAAIQQMEATMFAGFSEVHLEVRRVTEQGDVACIETDITAVNTNDLTLPDGTTIPATGRTVQIAAAVVATLDAEGRITEAHRYEDGLSFLRQLGLA
jgi:steroid delta-isomerase-like uncharacterized protein